MISRSGRRKASALLMAGAILAAGFAANAQTMASSTLAKPLVPVIDLSDALIWRS